MKEIYKSGFAGHKTVVGVLRTIECFNMIRRGDKVLISISGGPDSTFLAHLLYLMKPALDLELYGFCLDHMTREGESAEDTLFVDKLCRELGIKLFKRKIDVKKWCSSNKLSFQEGARKIRRRELLEISGKKDIGKIAVGHNADDNIETFFMRLMRGTGAKGLSGIRPVSGKFVRPLINTFRKDITTYLDDKKIPYCVDRTNLENIYFRNRIRNILIPFIEKNFTKSFKYNVLRSMNILGDEDKFLKQYAWTRLLDMASIKRDRAGKYTVLIKFSVPDIKKETAAVQRRIVLAALEMIRGTLEDIKFKNVDDILSICIMGGESKSVQPEEKVRVFKIGGFIYFVNLDYKDVLPRELELFLKGSKNTDIKGRGTQIKIGARMKLGGFNMEILSELLKPGGVGLKFERSEGDEAFIDYAKIKPPLKVRKWRRGDRFYPLGMKEEKKLQDFFTDNKVPVHLRKLIPVFTDSEKIIWLGKYRVDNRVKITEDTSEVLHLKLFKK